MTGNFAQILNTFLNPQKLWSRSEVLSKPCPVPKLPGLYAWYFREIPPGVPVEGCESFEGKTLLYIGISPSQSSGGGTLCSRIRDHYAKNAFGSTLRLSLGCLLSEPLGIRLQRPLGSSRIFFLDGEAVLSQWMNDNAFVTWVIHDKPWEVETGLIQHLNLPLNLRGNENHPFYPVLSNLRQKCRETAGGDR